jgi:hypothetical protein
VYQCALARTARTDHRHPFARCEGKGYVFQNGGAVLFVAKAHPVELKAVGLRWRKGPWGICDLRLGIHDLKEAFAGFDRAT